MSKDLNLLDLMPDSILDDPKIVAAAKAFDERLKIITEMTVQALHLPRLDVLPEPVLDLLAWQWHVDFYEPVGMDIETKRRLIRESIKWHRIKGTPAAVEEVASAAFDNTTVKEWFEYGGQPYHFRLITEDVTTDKGVLDRLRAAVFSVKNARSKLDGIDFLLHIEDEYAESGEGISDAEMALDVLVPMHDEVPYGNGIHELKYDGSAQYGGVAQYNHAFMYDGTILYDGVINADCPKYGKPLSYLFRYAGKAQYDGSLQYDGGFWYNGLKAYRLEYNDFMDELSVLVIILGGPNGKATFEDNVDELLQYDGHGQYNGDLQYGRNQAPIDSNGMLEVLRFRKYDGSTQYDGGDINYHNGTMQYDGLWQYDGGGIHYRIDRYVDALDGGLSIVHHDKLPPEILKYPRFEDDIEQPSEDSDLFINLGGEEPVLVDDVDELLQYDGHGQYNNELQYGRNMAPIDANGKLEILRIHRYDGRMQYDGGDINYFNGSMQYDGLWRYDGGGNHYRIDRITDALDGGLSIVHHEKLQPLALRYPELHDYPGRPGESNGMAVEMVGFEDNLLRHQEADGSVCYDGAIQAGLNNMPVDAGGQLQIIECRRYDKSIDYSGASGRQYDGGNRYDGSVKTKGGNVYGIVGRLATPL